MRTFRKWLESTIPTSQDLQADPNHPGKEDYRRIQVARFDDLWKWINFGINNYGREAERAWNRLDYWQKSRFYQLLLRHYHDVLNHNHDPEFVERIATAVSRVYHWLQNAPK